MKGEIYIASLLGEHPRLLTTVFEQIFPLEFLYRGLKRVLDSSFDTGTHLTLVRAVFRVSIVATYSHCQNYLEHPTPCVVLFYFSFVCPSTTTSILFSPRTILIV